MGSSYIVNNKNIEININPKYTTDLNGKFLFMRHGHTEFNSDHDKSRQKNPLYIDCHLSKKGIEQVKAKQKLINSLYIEKVYVSPFYRALQTASLLLENHPNLNNICVVVHPKIAEIGGCTHDFIFDIKKSKKDFNINAKVKFDWNIFDEYVRNIKYDENFFYFEEYNNLNDKEKSELYSNLKRSYDNNELLLYYKEMEKLAGYRIKIHKKFESLNHEYNRFLDFKNNLNKIHKSSLEDTNKKILMISHSSFIKVSTSPVPYLETNKKVHPSCHAMKNVEIISIYF